MKAPQITNQPGPHCELAIRIRFNNMQRFREEYERQIGRGNYFVKSPRNKPIGTRVQLVFLIESIEGLEIWSWGEVDQVISAEEADLLGGQPGMEIRLMDMNPQRIKELEHLMTFDDAAFSSTQGQQSIRRGSYPPTEEQNSLRKQLESLQLYARREDYYGLLKIPKNASPSDIRDAYRQRSKEYHPDQHYRKLPNDLHNTLQEIFQQITEAYRVLMDPAQRARYDSKIGNYTNPLAARASQAHVKKQDAFQKNYNAMIEPRRQKIELLSREAEADVIQGNVQGAISKLQLALTLDPLSSPIKKRIKELKEQLP
ncbi:MAG: DnaJ domain-containing protein [Myxococcales bacterium]|nr:DnaJ domain-containing protein [Myxococcales bacterium]MCB9641868.1 DnaJ domain-containing protein [Myxococcales bacterium]